MTRSLKIGIIALVIVLIALTGLSVGVTAAYWGGEGGGGGTPSTPGEGSALPQLKSSEWNAWLKYFKYDVVGTTVYITGYSNTTMSTLAFPKKVTLERSGTEGNYTYAYTTKAANATTIITYDSDAGYKFIIKSTFFSDTTLKEQITKIYVSDGVDEIQAYTFMGLNNLQAVYFEDSNTLLRDGCFMNCFSLTTVEGHAINKATAFIGCSNLVVA